jgi:hypothetical protein
MATTSDREYHSSESNLENTGCLYEGVYINDSDYNQRADLWSLGCVLSSTAAWVLLGAQSKSQYASGLDCADDYCDSDSISSIKEARAWLKELQKHKRLKRDKLTAEILRIVDTMMLNQHSISFDLDDVLEAIRNALKEPKISPRRLFQRTARLPVVSLAMRTAHMWKTRSKNRKVLDLLR